MKARVISVDLPAPGRPATAILIAMSFRDLCRAKSSGKGVSREQRGRVIEWEGHIRSIVQAALSSS
jgi:hypothetical protein